MNSPKSAVANAAPVRRRIQTHSHHTTAVHRRALSRAIHAGLALSLALPAHHVLAQALEEILITAERRQTTLQDTPMSVMAFSSADLQMKNVETMEDLAVNSPNLDIKGGRGSGNVSPTYQIRGISGGGGATGERGVGFYLDGVFVPRQTGPFMQVLDLERIEVLRGPQGTLFGRNSVGGAIRVFTQQPDFERSGYIRTTAGNFDRREVTLMYNTPVTDNLAIRTQAAWLEQDGFVERGPQNLGSNENLILRTRALWEPSANVSVSIGAMHLNTKSDGNPQVLENFDMDPVDPINGVSDVISFEGGYADWMSDFLEAAGESRLRSNDPRLVIDDYTMASYCFLDSIDPGWNDLCRQSNESRYTQLDATVNWQLREDLSFTSTTGYSDFYSFGITDWQLLGMERRPQEVESWTFYQEFQLNSMHFNDRLQLVTGLNYFHESSKEPRNYLLQAVGTSIFGAMGLPISTPTNQNPNGNDWAGAFINDDVATSQKAHSVGLFINGTWAATDRLNITSGLRFAYDYKDWSKTEYASNNFTPAPGTDRTTVNTDNSWTEVDWRLTLDYHVNEAFMLYGTASKAYRAGSFDHIILDEVPGEAQSGDFIRPVPPENLINYEMGFRSDWFDKRLRLNVTAFEMQYQDRQAAAAVADANAPTGFVIQLVNQGDITIRGIEMDAMLAVTDRLSLNASAGWLDPTVKDPCANNGPFMFPGPARHSYQMGSRYDFDLSGGGGLTFALNYAYVGPQHTHPGGVRAPSGCEASGPPWAPPTPEWFVDSRYELPGYGLLNARVEYRSADERWQVTVFGNNLTDRVYGNFATRFGGGYWEGPPPAPVNLKAPERSALGVTRGRPLNWGIAFQYNFGAQG